MIDGIVMVVRTIRIVGIIRIAVAIGPIVGIVPAEVILFETQEFPIEFA